MTAGHGVRVCSIPGCSGRHEAQDLCRHHYNRLRRHGHALALPKPPPTYQELFDLYTPNRGDSCWVWTGTINTNGYGLLRSVPKLYAHRWSYQRFNGPIPDGMLVRHTCDNRPCVNPAHLLVGTIKDNSHDSVTRRRHNYGEKVPSSRLTLGAALAIRRRAAAGEKQRGLAVEFGVAPATIADIVHGRTWVLAMNDAASAAGTHNAAEYTVSACSSPRFSPRALAVLVRDSGEWRQIETQREATP